MWPRQSVIQVLIFCPFTSELRLLGQAGAHIAMFKLGNKLICYISWLRMCQLFTVLTNMISKVATCYFEIFTSRQLLKGWLPRKQLLKGILVRNQFHRVPFSSKILPQTSIQREKFRSKILTQTTDIPKNHCSPAFLIIFYR